ncbi:ABC transporter permease [Burkholderia anthina]|uniref:ABC transporter permease n=1 Tax=Burkholderia anthina TaxID=179879 RepID=UPI001588E57C|nr:ABC transporter permease [Burkholderia anthina]
MSELESPFRANRSSLRIVRSVLFALFLREMQTRFGARRMGFVWVILEPLAILVVILTFHALLRATRMQSMDYVMFLVSGIVPFHMMRNIAWRLTDSIQANQGLFAYRQVAPFDTFVARLIVELCTYSCAYLIICFFLGFWLGHDVLISNPLEWLWAIGVGVFLSFWFGVAFAIIGHSIPGAARVCKLSFIPLYITSGIFFPIWNMPEKEIYFFSWNPYVEVVDGIRAAVFDNYPVTKGLSYSYPLCFAIVLAFFVMVAYRRQRQALRSVKV